jgi:hypothetical protein
VRVRAGRGVTGSLGTGGRGTWDRWSGGGLLVVAAAGATLSCTSLAGLARACGYGPHLAWLLPVSIDAYAFVAMRVWLCSGADQRVLAWAAASGWLAIAASVAGNATYHAIETGRGAQLVVGEWQAGIAIVMLVGAAPAVFVGAAVTLLHLAQPPATNSWVENCPAEATGTEAPPPRVELRTATAPALPPAGAAVPVGSKTARLRELVLSEVGPGDGRSVSELARVYAPRVGLHEASARKTIAAALRERPTAGADVVQLTARGGTR